MWCFYCQYKGTIVGGDPVKVEKKHTDVSLQNKVFEHIIKNSKLHTDTKDWFSKRGINHPEKYNIVNVGYRPDSYLKEEFSEEQLIASGLFYKLDSWLNKTLVIKPGRILFPYWQENKYIGFKSRASIYEDTECKYATPVGSSLFSHPFYYGKLSGDLIITEGEFAALTGYEYGLSVLSIPSVSTIKILKDEIKTIIKDNHISRVFIIMDTDKDFSNSLGVIRAAVQGANLYNGIILFLPQKDNEKMDLDKYLYIHGKEKLLKLMELASINKKRLYLHYKTKLSELEINKNHLGTLLES